MKAPGTALNPHTLNDGTTLPAIGFGTYGLQGAAAVNAVVSALDLGYRLLDTAANYGNEAEVGEGIRRSGVPRDQIVVTSKIPARHLAYDDAIRSTRASVERLGLDHVDLQLIHWPNPAEGRYPQAWRALVALRDEGLVRSPGVSNFTERLLEEVIADTGVTPVVNQVEVHPYFPQAELRAVHERLGIVTEAWSPFAHRQTVFGEPVIEGIAAAHGVTPGQVVMRWHLQLGTLPIPKSGDPGRQRENLAVGSFALTSEELATITALGHNDGRWFGGDPETHIDH